MLPGPVDLAQVRLDNALRLFDEFVRATARHADAATLRGLERRFAERVQIQPSYWSQIKSRSRQIGERLARQFEHLCHKPQGWMDLPHDERPQATPAAAASAGPGLRAAPMVDDSMPLDDDERFIVGLVLTYYRRHPQRARTRLLDLLGEVLVPGAAGAPSSARSAPVAPSAPSGPSAPSAPRPVPATPVRPASPGAARADDDAQAMWSRTKAGIAPLKRKR